MKSFESSSAIANLLEHGAKLRANRLRASDLWTLSQAAADLAVEASQLTKLIKRGECIGVVRTDGEVVLPKWQLEPEVWLLVGAISSALETTDGWAILSFIEAPARGLDGLALRTFLERGLPPSRVLALAVADAY